MIHFGWMGTFQTEHDFILSSLYAGVTLGAGLGIVFRFGGTGRLGYYRSYSKPEVWLEYGKDSAGH